MELGSMKHKFAKQTRSVNTMWSHGLTFLQEQTLSFRIFTCEVKCLLQVILTRTNKPPAEL